MVEADICGYSGTSGGVIAAVQAARIGRRTVLAEPGRHLGGMTAGGLSAVDIGDPRSAGGLAREYFTRLAGRYGKHLAWDDAFEHKDGGPATGGAYSIEPHVTSARATSSPCPQSAWHPHALSCGVISFENQATIF